MGEADLPAGDRQRDLAVVHVPGEDEVEVARLELVEDARVVAEQDREVGLSCEVVRIEPRPAANDEPRVGSGDPHAPSPELEQTAFVTEQRGRLELPQVGPAGLRVPAERDVVVAEDRKYRLREDPHEPSEHRLSPRMGEEIAADGDDVRLPLPCPHGRLPGGADARRRHAEVGGWEVRDPQAVQLGRQVRQLELELTEPHPPGFDQAPPEARCDRPAELSQTSSRSSAGRGSTMWRLNLSSASSSPAATPTSWARWSTGILKARPVEASSFCCQASSERWQSGHGVPITSAPASIACSTGWMTSPSAVSSRAAMIGKPQHLTFAG